MLDLNKQTYKAFCEIAEMDKKFIGTENYMGVAFFWNYEYRHYLRDTTIKKRQKVHKKFLDNNLHIAGKSEKHLEIIRSITKLN